MTTIGLVGFNTLSGLGELNRQLAHHCSIDRWLIKPHPQFRLADMPAGVECLIDPYGKELIGFVKSCDVILFCETPYYIGLPQLCRRFNRRLVCVPMQERMPANLNGWPRLVDLFLCPTRQCHEIFHARLPCTYTPLPIDTDRFVFRQRETCDAFLFLAGHGGWHNRKGIPVVSRAWKSNPGRLIVRGQLDLARSFQNTGAVVVPGEVADNRDLYAQGDVLIAPHSVDGIGLELLEAAACGLPVISTNGEPWNEYPALDRVPARVCQRRIERMVDWYEPNPDLLASICKFWFRQRISHASLTAHQWAESRSWNVLRDKFLNALLGARE